MHDSGKTTPSGRAALPEELFEDLLELIPDLICLFSPDGIIAYANATYCSFLKKDRADLVGTSIFTHIPPQDRKILTNYLKLLSPEDPVQRVEYRTVEASGDPQWQEWILRGIFDDSGTLTHYLSSGRDITAAKQMEYNLIEALEKYSSLYESSNDAIILLDRDRVIDCNSATLKIFGYTEKIGLMNLHYKELSAPAQKDGSLSDAVLENHIKDALTMGVAKFQWLFRKHDGTHFFADVVLSPFPLEGRTLITAMIRDITLQHLTAEALRKR
ncbi:MAG: PAS domain-containing protein, partial [Desulfomonilia bacterium]|nr:PAS domain-containing protein [Desulfomonilia bacterium]